MPSGLWSGLVQGLGGSLQQGFNRKHEEEMQQKHNMFQLVSSALMNDDTLPGTARREGLKQLGAQYGVKISDELISQLVPDVPVETDRYQAEMPPQNVQLPSMPTPPEALQRSAPGDGHGGQATPQQGGDEETQGLMRQDQMEHGNGQILPPMPRDPFKQGPQILGSGALGQASSSPVVQQYTSGHGSNFDDLDLQLQIKQLENKLNNPPSRQDSTISSLNMSRAQMNEMRGKRLQQEQQDRDLAMNQYQNLSKLKIQHEEQVREIQLQPLMMKAKLDGIQQAMGRPLTDPEKGRAFGIDSPQAQSRAYDADDYRIAATQPNTPEGQAALQRIKKKELENTSELLNIRQSQVQIAKMVQEMKDPMSNPKLLAKAKVESVKSASTQWTISDRQKYLEDRTNYWEQNLSDPMTVAQSGNSDLAQFAMAAKDNPMAKRKLAIELAQKDVQQYQQNLQDKIFMYGVPSGSQVITLHWLRKRAEFVKNETGNPQSKLYGLDPVQAANTVWDFYKKQANEKINPKDESSGYKATILDDDLEIWSDNPQPSSMPEIDNRPPLKVGETRKFIPKN